MTVNPIPTPPRLTGGSPEEMQRALSDWMYQVYNSLIREANVLARVDALAQIETLDLEISATPTQEELETVRDKLNEVINAARTS